jgi:tetratricopeptide (TPR) repeat protein
MPDNPQPTRAVEVFYSYAHEDEKLKDELLKHLANIERQGIIVSWHDRKITGGREWAGEIDGHINTAGLILLLVSSDFMSSGYCNDVELQRAMERHEAKEARVIPVILRPVDFKGAPFEKLQALPTDARPVTRRRNRDAALLEVAQGIREAVEEIAAQSSSAASRKTHEAIIPRPPVVGFVARRDEQGRDIVELLRVELVPEKNQLVTLWGPGGAGKTTLAAELVRATEGVFKGRIVWASSLRRTDFNLATLLDEIATQLGREDLRKLAPEDKEREVGALITQASALIILDNFETIGEKDEATARQEQTRCLDFLAQSAACPALITTRSFVNRDDIANVRLAAMSLEEAREFLQRLIAQTGKPSAFAKLDRDDLIQRCEANPLVLQWVVRQIVLANRPQDVLKDLSQGEGDAAERVFTRSFNLPQLGDDGRSSLLALSLFTPNASRESLAEVAGFGDDLRRLNKSVEKLSALWLVETTDGNERLFLRGLTRELSKTYLSKDPRADEFRCRYVAYFLRHTKAHSQPTPEDLGTLESDKGNLLGAIDAAFEMQDWASVMRIRYALEEFLDLRGYWDDAVKRGEQAVSATRRIPVDVLAAEFEMSADELVAVFVTNNATILFRRGEYDEARRDYKKALAAFKGLRSDENVAVCLHQLASVAQEQGKITEAQRLFNESLKIATKYKDRRGVALTTWSLGNIALRRGKRREAKRLFEKALKTFKSVRDRKNTAGVLHQLGVIEQLQGNLSEARRLYDESLKIRKRLVDQNGIANSLSQLGRLAVANGDKQEATRLFREALSIFEKLRSSEAEKVRGDLAKV